jgi:non-ribosomal peptide synthetase-like protein
VPVDYLSGTPLLNLYFRLLGARIGEDVKFSTTNLDVPDLISIGSDSVLSYQAALTCAHVQGGWLDIQPIEVGRNCHIGPNALMNGGSRLGNGAALDQLSMLPRGEEIPAGELWSGSPAQPAGMSVHSSRATTGRSRALTKFIQGAGYVVLCALLAICAIAPLGPGMALLTKVEQESSGLTFLLFTPAVALSFVVFMALELAVLKWLIVGRLKPGKYPVHGGFYVRWWFVDKLMALSLDILKPIYATLYLAPWYRMLGVHLGARAEVSTASGITLDLLSIGQESFIADAVVLGVPVIDGDHLILEETKIAPRAFVGNSALVPAGTAIGEDVLIGCLSVPPIDEARALEKGSSWFGIPAIYLPQRAQEQQFDEGSTFRPPTHLVLQRLAIEGIRVILPLTVLIALNSLLIGLVSNMAIHHEVLSLILLFPFCFMGAATLAGAFVVLLKWLVIGRYRPAVLPLWNRFVWCSELVTSTYENLAVPMVCELLKGTPFLPMYWRLLGAKFGKRVFCDTTDITEFDMVTVGDGTSLNWECGLQTHLFEDRVMKISAVRVGASCCIGSLAIALYDSEMQEGAALGGLSILMKGETLPSKTSWIGSPARKCRRNAPASSTQIID